MKRRYNNGIYEDYEDNEVFSELSPQDEIFVLKSKLVETDYQAIKHSEGWISDEDYEPIKAQRQAWRDRINELENGGNRMGGRT